MSLDWILSPLTIYAAVALGLAACTSLFLATKIEMSQFRRSSRLSREELARRLEELETTAADAAAEAPAVPPVKASVNLTKRAQALRMKRRGESVESITAALAVPRNEVELLLKLNEFLEAPRKS
jgi:hypothetical protein